MRALKAAQERLVAAEKRLSDFKNAPELLVKAQSVLSAAVANLENKKEKLEAEFTTLTILSKCRGTVEFSI